MSVGKRLPAARIQEHKIEFASFDRLQYVVSLFFRAKLVEEVIAIGTNICKGNVMVVSCVSKFSRS
jgi:hypothetical protein